MRAYKGPRYGEAFAETILERRVLLGNRNEQMRSKIGNARARVETRTIFTDVSDFLGRLHPRRTRLEFTLLTGGITRDYWGLPGITRDHYYQGQSSTRKTGENRYENL